MSQNSHEGAVFHKHRVGGCACLGNAAEGAATAVELQGQVHKTARAERARASNTSVIFMISANLAPRLQAATASQRSVRKEATYSSTSSPIFASAAT